VVEPALIIELQKQHLDWKRELGEQENPLLTREHGVVEAERAFRRSCMECDAAHDQAGVIEQDYHARLRASTPVPRHSLEFLDGR
jgi:hypothetical protein